MSNVFTFVCPSAFRSRTEIYRGSFKSSSEIEGMQPAYEVILDGRVLKLTSDACPAIPLITCRLEGFFRRKGKLYGTTAIAPIRQNGRFSNTWIIHDFEGNEYKWKYGKLRGPAWSLIDTNENVFATFDRSGFKMHVLGRLTVTKPVSKEFLDIILLTNRLVHKTVQDSETAAIAASS